MGITRYSAVLSVALVIASGMASAADDAAAERARIGEVRLFALALSNKEAVADLHHDGWIEAHGQLLSTLMFPELFKLVGRTWTADGVQADRFAIPDIPNRFEGLVSSDNPFGVLGPGDLVTSGRLKKAWLRKAPLSYWIFAGHAAQQAIAGAQR